MIYDDFAEKIVDDYDLFLLAISGRYQAIAAPGIEISPKVIKDFIVEGKKLGDTFLAIVDSEIDDYLEWIYPDSIPPKSAEDGKFELLEGIKKGVVENLVQVTKLLRVGLQDYKRLLKTTSGSMGQLVQKKMGTIDFKLFDSMNRRWDARRLVKVAARDFAYQAWIDLQVAKIAASGSLLAKVVYDDPAKATREMVFSVGEKIGAYPTLAEIRSAAFHPNSTAKVVAYVLP